ncbi:hypothetical protein FF38_00568, partial [Lucilia cuprina]
MAPEVIHNVIKNQKQGYSAKVDVWSLGCVILEMFVGRRPWSTEEAIGAMYKLGSSRQAPPIPEDSKEHVSKEGKGFLDECFIIDAKKRPTAHDLLSQPFCDSGETDNNSYDMVLMLTKIGLSNEFWRSSEGARKLNELNNEMEMVRQFRHIGITPLYEFTIERFKGAHYEWEITYLIPYTNMTPLKNPGHHPAVHFEVDFDITTTDSNEDSLRFAEAETMAVMHDSAFEALPAEGKHDLVIVVGHHDILSATLSHCGLSPPQHYTALSILAAAS